MNAPVCPISRPQVPSGQPGETRPAIPHAVDLPSLLQAVNAMRTLIFNYFGPGMVINNLYPPQQLPPFGHPQLVRSNSSGKGKGKQAAADWKQTEIDTEDLRVFHKKPDGTDDEEQYVDVTRINRIVYTDRNSEDVFIWEGEKKK